MKILSKIKIHPFFCLFMIISICTGMFHFFISFSLLIIFHELGHILASQIFNYKIEKIIILPFGGITIFNTFINNRLISDLIVAIAGPIFQIIFYILFNTYLYKDTMIYHYTLLFINLLPIIPLDGSKILSFFIYKIFSFNIGHLILIYFSFILEFLLFIHSIYIHNLFLFIMTIFLFRRVYFEYINHKYIFDKFILERVLYDFNFKKVKIIKEFNIKKMYKDYYHFFDKNLSIFSEKDILKKYIKS